MAHVNAPKSVIDASKRLAIRESLLNLLCEEKKAEIAVRCGLKALDLVMQMPEYNRSYDDSFLMIASCVIKLERDFDLDPWEIWYNDTIIFE